MEVKSSSSSTSAAASRATSVPRPPIAMPMCAAFSAGASFTPSPVIATTSPFAFNASTSRSFCSGTTRQSRLQLTLIECVQLGAGHRAASARQPDFPCDVQRSRGVIACDHDYADARLPGFGDRFQHAGTNRIKQTDQSQEFEFEVVLDCRQLRLTKSPLGDGEN